MIMIMMTCDWSGWEFEKLYIVDSHFRFCIRTNLSTHLKAFGFMRRQKSPVDLQTKVSQWDLTNGRTMHQNHRGRESCHLFWMVRMMQWHQVRHTILCHLHTCAGTTMTVHPQETKTTNFAGEALLPASITPRGLITLLHCRFRNNHEPGPAKAICIHQTDQQSTACTHRVMYQDLKSVVSGRSAKGSLCAILADSGSILTQICRR